MLDPHVRRRWLVPAAWVVSVVIAAAIGFWAARATLVAPVATDADAAPVLYTVAQGSVGQVISFTAEASWTATPLAPNGIDGTVTTLEVQPGQLIETGARLYSVNLRPVIAAVGEVPAFRDLAANDRGTDVAQLQRFLRTMADYEGTDSGTFDRATDAAVRAWQKRLGITVDGVVRQGDLIFIPELPARVSPADGLRVGARIGAGEPALDLLPPAPSFSITLGPEQADLVPLDATVIIERDEGKWEGSIASSTTAPTGELVLTLAGMDGEPLCGDACASVPIDQPGLYTADLVVVPTTTGPLVPVAAMVTSPSGAVHVVGADGGELPVTIEAASGGQAVVSGVEPGTVIRLFGDASDGGIPDVPGPS